MNPQQNAIGLIIKEIVLEMKLIIVIVLILFIKIFMVQNYTI